MRSTTRQREPLGGFEYRLLDQLTELDRTRVVAPADARDPGRGRRHRRSVVIGAVAAAALFGTAGAVAGILASPATLQSGGRLVMAGDSLVMKGSGCAAGAAVTLRLDRAVPLGSTTAQADGLFAATITVPPATVPGEHDVVSVCVAPDGTELVQSDWITVTAIGPPEPLGPAFDAGTASPGGTVLFKGAGCRPGTTVSITVDGIPDLEIGSTAGAEGQFAATGSVPAAAEVGGYRARAGCEGPDGRTLAQDAPLVLVPAEPAQPPMTKPAR